MDKENTQEPIMTHHARERWNQRCPTLSLEEEWSRARRVGGKVKKKIYASCPGHSPTKGWKKEDVYYLISPSRVVFVCNYNQVVITVFTLH